MKYLKVDFFLDWATFTATVWEELRVIGCGGVEEAEEGEERRRGGDEDNLSGGTFRVRRKKRGWYKPKTEVSCHRYFF